jgi:uncharacterized protein (TIGR02246 family)
MDPVTALLEREAIAARMHQYCRSIDTRDVEGYLDTFAPDGLANYTRDDVVGRDALRAFYAKFIEGLMAATQHQVSNIEVAFADEASATSTSYVSAWHRFQAERPDYLVHGIYHDTWTKADGTWRMAARRIQVLGEVHQPRL